MRIAELYTKVLEYFDKAMPIAETELHYENPFQLLIAVILSAQCTDKRVNMVTPDLFARYDTPQELAEAHPDEVFNYIKSISYPNNKARHLVGMAQKLVENFNSEVPDTLESLTTLPGVGRKTANVVQAVAFKKPALAVDTHVFRVSHRMGLSLGKTPLEVEHDLNKIVPENERAIAHHWLILHGRYICTARNPKCAACPVSQYCNSSLA